MQLGKVEWNRDSVMKSLQPEVLVSSHSRQKAPLAQCLAQTGHMTPDRPVGANGIRFWELVCISRKTLCLQDGKLESVLLCESTYSGSVSLGGLGLMLL